MDRKPEPWETNATRPFLTVDSVGVTSLGDDRFVVVGPSDERAVVGYEVARQLAHDLAARETA